MNNIKISVIIPCLNEENTIAECIDSAISGIKETNLSGEVIVVDNGSIDRSVEIAKSKNIRLETVQMKGYGSALQYGFLKANGEIVVYADADLSYDFRFISLLIAPILSNSADLVLANRINNNLELKAMPFLNRYLGTPVLSFLIRVLHKLPTYDCNSGMRAIRLDSYKKLQIKSTGMEFASEMLIMAAKNKLKYKEVSITFKRDKRGRPPHLKRWRDGMRHLITIMRYL